MADRGAATGPRTPTPTPAVAVSVHDDFTGAPIADAVFVFHGADGSVIGTAAAAADSSGQATGVLGASLAQEDRALDSRNHGFLLLQADVVVADRPTPLGFVGM